MRVTSVALAAALLGVCVTTSLRGEQAAPRIDPRSLALLARGQTANAAGNLDGATDALETALAVDPRNRAAFVLLAEIADHRELPGKAIRLYREALLLDPNDVNALAGQGEALVHKGAVNLARVNLAKIKTLCRSACAPASSLAAVIARGPPVATAQVDKAVIAPKE